MCFDHTLELPLYVFVEQLHLSWSYASEVLKLRAMMMTNAKKTRAGVEITKITLCVIKSHKNT